MKKKKGIEKTREKTRENASLYTVSQFLNAGAAQIDKVTNTADSGSTSSGGGGGILSGATNFIDRISNVIDPPPIPLKVSY